MSPDSFQARTAASITELGSADAIRVGELPVPAMGPTDVLVEVAAVAVNHVDTFVRSGQYRTPMSFPFVIGRDLVGSVLACGDDVARFQPGDAVWCNSMGYEGRQGSFATAVVVPVDRLYELPAGVEPSDAVAALHPAATAYLGLFRHARIEPGDTVMVGGGGGAVGSAAVQLASQAGARVLATAASRDAEWCRQCGADEVLDYRSEDLFSELATAAPEGINVYWDTSGHSDLERTVPLLAKGGRILITAASRPQTLHVIATYVRDISIHGFALSNASVTALAEAAALINDRLRTGRLTVRIGHRLPLTAAAEAHRLQEAGGLRGRIVLHP